MEEEFEVQKQSKQSLNIKIMGFVVINFVIMAVMSLLVYQATIGGQTEVATEEKLTQELEQFKQRLKHDVNVLYAMETLTTNLKGVPKRTVKVDISLEMMDAEGFEEIIEVNAEARDKVMRILNSVNFKDIETLQNKLELKNHIIAGVNGFLSKGVVKNVYFTGFVVQ